MKRSLIHDLRRRPAELPGLMVRGRLRIAIVGLGRIGLATAALFAGAGANVTGIDIREDVVRETNAGKCRLADEPGMLEAVSEAVKKGRLKATIYPDEAISEADFIIVCVPTPIHRTKIPDYSAVHSAARTMGKNLSKGSVVVIESTVGPGFVEETVVPTLESESGMKVGVDFGVASCPERSDPGNILKDMRSLPRIVGGLDKKTTDAVASLYETALGVKAIRVSNPKTANAVKLTENLFRDVNIALANEFALLFEKLGIDCVEVIDASASKYNFVPHYPGGGVGGPCLPSNSYYLISEGAHRGSILHLVRMAREINDGMPDHVVALVSEALNDVGKAVRGSKVVVLGAAYKPNVRDLQSTPVERVVTSLRQLGARVEIFDPMFKGERVFGLRVGTNPYAAVRNADCLVVETAHGEFRRLELEKLSRLARMPAAIVDARGVFSPKAVIDAGFSFRGVGRNLRA